MVAVLIGFFAGIAGGMGIGGGTLLIPALNIFMSVGIGTASGTNLLSFVPTAAASLFVSIKNQLIDKKLVLLLAAGGVAGAAGGSFLSALLKEDWLGKLFGIFLLLLGIRELFGKHKQ